MQKIIKQKIINNNFEKKTQINQQNTKKISHNTGNYCQRLKAKNNCDKNSKGAPQTPTKHLQPTLAVRCTDPENSPKRFT